MTSNSPVPDNWEDPQDVAEKEARRLFDVSYKKHSEELAKATAWYACWQAYAQNPSSPENPHIPTEELCLALMMKMEYYLLEILSELRKVKK